MAKSPDAFRTISEVSEWLDTPAHVLRFWESKFTQIKPVKRAGGRRYYRPEDMALLGGIKTLLHEQGMTIKGVQKLLREQGIRHVAALGPQPLDDDDTTVAQAIAPDPAPATVTLAPVPDRGPEAAAPPARPPAFLQPAVAHAPAPLPAAAAPTPAAPDPAPALRRALPDLPPEAASARGLLSAILARDPVAIGAPRPGGRTPRTLARPLARLDLSDESVAFPLALGGDWGRRAPSRAIAQPGSASVWGTEGRRFKSC